MQLYIILVSFLLFPILLIIQPQEVSQTVPDVRLNALLKRDNTIVGGDLRYIYNPKLSLIFLRITIMLLII
jgi:hypothetical protein